MPSFPLTKIAFSEMLVARCESLSPAQVGDWDYRGSLKRLGHATLFIRSRETLTLDLTKNRCFRLTIDDAETAAGLINDLCQQRDA